MSLTLSLSCSAGGKHASGSLQHPSRRRAPQAFDRIRSATSVRYPAVCGEPTLRNHNKLSEPARGLIHLSIIGDSFINCTPCHLAGLATHKVNPSWVWDAGQESDAIKYESFKKRTPLDSLRPPRTVCLSTRGEGDSLTQTTSPHNQVRTQRLQVDGITQNQHDTHHITNGGDVSDSHLVYSVPLTAIFIK